jgi:hypothetical protein
MGIDVRDDRLERRVCPHACIGGRRRAACEERQILGARFRFREERFEQQMQQQVVAPDVDDEGDRRPRAHDV